MYGRRHTAHTPLGRLAHSEACSCDRRRSSRVKLSLTLLSAVLACCCCSADALDAPVRVDVCHDSEQHRTTGRTSSRRPAPTLRAALLLDTHTTPDTSPLDTVTRCASLPRYQPKPRTAYAVALLRC